MVASSRRLFTVLGVILLLAVAVYSCPTGFYGADCTCTSDLQAALGSVSATLTCSNGVWNSSGPIAIINAVDMMYDGLWVPATGTSASSIKIFDTANLTLHILEYADGTLKQARFETPGELNANGSIHLIFDRLEQAQWSIQFAEYGSLIGAPRLGVSSNATEFSCRTFTSPALPVFLPNEARFNNSVTNTHPKCGFNKGSRNWALYVFIAIASLGGALIIFSIFTCVINPWRKLIWYPPM